MQRWDRAATVTRWVAAVTATLLAVWGVVQLVRLMDRVVVVGSLAGVAVAAAILHRGVRRHLPGRLLLEVDLEDGVVEAVPESPVATVGKPRLVLRHVIEALDRAAADARVRAVIVRLGTSGVGLAQAQELRDALLRVRRARIRTVAVAETFGESDNGTVDYYLASACGEVVLQRVGEFGVLGFLARAPFVRGALDRLSIVPRFDHRREYKSAMYLLTEEAMPQPQAEATARLLETAAHTVTAAIASDRGMPREEVVSAIDEGPLLPREAFVRGFVDRLGFADEVKDELVGEFGATAVELPTYHQRAVRHRRGAELALVYAVGAIVRGRGRPGVAGRGATVGADDVVAAIEAAVDSGRIRALVLRVDSRGGSAVASEAIWHAVNRAREAGKPVVASLGNVAGSGGYYIACGADRVVAQSGTITGSIGVVSGKLVTKDAWERLGIRWGEITAGENAAIWSSQSDFSDEQWQRFQRYLDEVYEVFKLRVATGRGLPEDEVEAVAKGRVWSGVDALEHGLVDELGGLERAVAIARELAGIPIDQHVRLRVLPRRSKLPWRRLGRRGAALAEGWQRIGRATEPLTDVLETVSPPGVLWWDGHVR